ncbi:MAG: hypothetical protein ACYTG4_04465 [Planctomycetota bacterium]
MSFGRSLRRINVQPTAQNMLQMLVRNRVADYDKWKAVFDAQESRNIDAGLTLAKLWRSSDDPNNVFFLLDVSDRAKAVDFLQHPDSARAGEESGVIDGEFWWLDAQ